MNKIRIYIVDDHPVMCKGLKLLFNAEKDFEVVGTATDGKKALNDIEQLNPNIVLTDISMPEMSGLEVLRSIKQRNPDLQVIILTMHKENEYVFNALEEGASAYVFKDDQEDLLLKTVRDVNSGKYMLPAAISDVIMHRFKALESKTPTAKNELHLTSRESDILQRVIEGQSNKMIAYDLNITAKTVSVHRYNVMRKLGAKNAADLVRIALDTPGLLKNTV